MEFRLLGSLEVLERDRPVDLGAPRERALFAFLLLNANQTVSRDRIVEALWPEGAPRTAAKVVQVYVVHLRRALGELRERLESRGTGYALRVEPDERDLDRFELLLERAAAEDPRRRAQTLREALALWRGPALSDFAYDDFVYAEAARLEELRLLALERRIETDLELGAGPDLVPELESLVAEHPLRERLRADLMVALYRAGRQADALGAFREARRLLADELGLEPSAELRALEGAILRQDPALSAPSAAQPAIVVIPEHPGAMPELVTLGAALASGPSPKPLVLAEIVGTGDVAERTAALDRLRANLVGRGLTARVAAFSSASPGLDAARLASQQDAVLLLLSTTRNPFDGPFAAAFEHATCDVAVLVEAGGPPGDGPVVVPFGAFEHDWAALELGIWLAKSLACPLRLAGATDGRAGGVDASRLLADASLVVQHTTGIVAEPLIGRAGSEGVTELAAGAGVLVVGVSERWRMEGLGETRSALVARPPAPMVLVRRGLRPGGLAPSESLTRFTWSIERSRSGR